MESSKAHQTYSPTMDDLIKAFYSIEVHLPSFWWVERVPGKSNPGDEPSRFEGRASAALWNARFLPGFQCQAKVADWLIKTASQRRLGCLSGGNKNRSVPGITNMWSHIQTDGSGDLSPGLECAQVTSETSQSHTRCSPD